MYRFVYFGERGISAVQGHPRSLILVPIESAYVIIGVTYGGYGGYAYPPLFGAGVPYPPLFGRVIEKITATFPHPTLT